jgi:polyvinyl alcohol dehydrogenase (cytochrome)
VYRACARVRRSGIFVRPLWNGWGQNLLNTRFQNAAQAGISASDLTRLKVKWAFGFPATLDANAHPAIANGRIFHRQHQRYGLFARRCVGLHPLVLQCTGRRARGISIGRIKTDAGPRYAAFFGDGGRCTYAVDAGTGRLLWKTKVDTFPVARITGSPVFYNNRVYVPGGIGRRGRRRVAGLRVLPFPRKHHRARRLHRKADLENVHHSGRSAHKTKKNKIGTQLWGPSGAPIWSSPSIDVSATRSTPPPATTTAIPQPHERRFPGFRSRFRQDSVVAPDDRVRRLCLGLPLPDKTNCPDSNGPDFDFSSGPILVTLANGKRALVAGQKSGLVHAVDPDNQGEQIWSVRVGEGGTNGGVQWGSATDGTNVYVALADLGRIAVPYSLSTDVDPKRGGGMFALNLDTGKQVWYTPPASCGDRKRCSPAQSAAVTAIPGVAFSGSVDGHLRGYSTTDGGAVGLRHHRAIQDSQRRGSAGRVHGWSRPGHRGRNAVREFRVRGRRRDAGECVARVFGGWKVIAVIGSLPRDHGPWLFAALDRERRFHYRR